MEDRLTHDAAAPPGFDREEGLALGGLVVLCATTIAWWLLAFWPAHAAPVWLERTRYVCFGVNETGLPDAGGWIALIAGPLGMLALLLTGWGHGVRLLLRRARTSPALAALLALLFLSSAIPVAAAGRRVRDAGAAVLTIDGVTTASAAHYPRLDYAAPALALLAHDGTTRTLAQLRGTPVLVTFAYAHCTTVCPLVVKHVLTAQQTLRTDNERVAVIVVTLDPWRDTPSRLAAMAQQWSLPEHDAWIVGGDVTAVEAMLDAWHVARQRDPQNGAVTHPSLVYVVDRAGRIAYAATGGVDLLVGLVRRL